MAHRDIIVVGCSLGGVEALPRLVAGLSPKLRASVFIVLHMLPTAKSYLPQYLKNPAFAIKQAVDGEAIEPGTIYLAVPDHHLLIDKGKVRLSRGPKESHARPSADALFRSAAFDAGARVIGVVLTGQLDDGTAGLWSIKDRGGVAIVQDPDDAAYPSMPRSARAHVDIDYVLPLDEIPSRLLTLVEDELPSQENTSMAENKLETEVAIALDDVAFERGVRGLGEQSFFTCPECHGSMVRIKQGAIRRFRCHTGHAFSALALADGGLTSAEDTLWSALAQLEEHYVLLDELQAATREPGTLEEQGLQQRSQQIKDLMRRVRELARDPAFEKDR